MSSITLKNIRTGPVEVNIVEYPIKEWIDYFNTNKFQLPIWQRQHCWDSKDDYASELIKSILLGHDIPKLYLAVINSGPWQLIDGGHRTRSINSYMNNKFSIKIDGCEYYYNKTPKSTRNTKCLSDESDIFAKFNDYKLTVSKYENVSEKVARDIFNKLQNSAPMTVPDVINSHESYLIDFLRELMKTQITVNGSKKPLHKFYTKGKLKSIDNDRNSLLLEELCSKFTIFYPMDYNTDGLTDRSTMALSSLLKGTNKSSPTLQYVRNFTDELTEDTKANFIKFMENFIKIKQEYEERNINISEGELNSLIHSELYVTNFCRPKFDKFIEVCYKYNDYRVKSEKQKKHKNYVEAQKSNESADNLNDKYDGDIVAWAKTKKSGGNDKSGMKNRLGLINKRCLTTQNPLSLDTTGLPDGMPLSQGTPL